MPESRPPDDAAVRAVAVGPLPASVRAQLPSRRAADDTHGAGREAVVAALPDDRRRWPVRDLALGTLAAAVVITLLLWMHQAGSSRFAAEPVNPWAGGAQAAPAEAESAPPAAAAAPTGGGGHADPAEHGGRPAAFDPCQPVHYVVRHAGAPPLADQLVQTAVAQIGEATGLGFVAEGPSDEAPAADRPARQPDRYGDRWAPVLIAWSGSAEDEGLAGGTPAVLDPDGRGPRIVTGQVVLDGEVTRPEAVLQLLLRELSHLVGLERVGDPAVIVHAESGPAIGLTPLALRDLQELGDGPCFG